MKRTLMITALVASGAFGMSAAALAQDAPAAQPAATATKAQAAPAATPAAKSQTATPATKAQTTPAAKSATPAAGTASAQKPAAKTGTTNAKTAALLVLKTPKEKRSYAIGMSIGKGMKKDEVQVDTAILARGVKDALAGGKTALTDEEAQQALTELQLELRAKSEAKTQELAANNKKLGDAFLEANKAKEGVVTLPSGLQYKILKQGDGPKPTAQDVVTTNYKGTLIDGTEFDSSYRRGQPATFGVSQVIRGWTEALQLMPVGSKWELFIPSDLAYGPRNAGPTIGPNSTLVFEVELLDIKKKEEQKPDAPKAEAPATKEQPQAKP